MVYLVGAGPGDPGLVTLKALALVRRADVLLYDRLIDDTLLAETRPDCELVDVGKSADRHTRTQDEITELLVEYGGKGLEVVRLKGGDPFLFGRGGEEAAALAEAGIPFEIVPGVSALSAATAYAGIPLTHRDCASSIGVATGHGARGKPEDPVDWRALGRGVDTVVVFMGVGALAHITAELMAGGRDGGTPAAVIENGCSPRQRTITGTLAGIADAASAAQVNPPALLVVGETVRLRDRLDWYRPGPLGGLRIGVTRPLVQSREFCDTLRDLGGVPVPMPTVETMETIDTPEVADTVAAVETYDIVVFSSVNGVDAFMRALRAGGKDARALAKARLACIGPVTAERLERHGLAADVVAERYIAEGLLDTLMGTADPAGRRALVVRSDMGRTVVRDGLAAAGARVDELLVYTVRTVPLHPHVAGALLAGGIDVVTFTSSSTVDGLFASVPPDNIPPKVRMASIGPQTSAALRAHGFEPWVEAESYTTGGLAAAILAASRGTAGHSVDSIMNTPAAGTQQNPSLSREPDE